MFSSIDLDISLLCVRGSKCADSFGIAAEDKGQMLAGNLPVAFFLMDTPASLRMGYLSDVMSRRKLFCAMSNYDLCPNNFGEFFQAHFVLAIHVPSWFDSVVAGLR